MSNTGWTNVLNTNFTSRLSASPWWPLALWLGVPATLSNLSMACWPVLEMHAVLSGSFYGTSASFWAFVQFATVSSFLLLLIQTSVLSLVLACGPGIFWRRLSVYWGAIAGLALGCGGGFILAYWLTHWLETWQARSGLLIHDSTFETELGSVLWAAGSVPVLLLGFQTPFWFLRLIVGWRLEREAEPENAAADLPDQKLTAEALSIRNLMEATAIIGVSLGLLQLSDQFAEQVVPATHVLNTLTVSGLCAGGSLILALPLTLLFLRSGRLSTAWVLTLAVVLLITASLSAVAFAADAVGGSGVLLANIFFITVLLFGSQALALSLLRLYGWRLVGRVNRSVYNLSDSSPRTGQL